MQQENYYIKNQLVFNTKAKVYRYIDSALDQFKKR